ncbi:hypothetical protein [Bradyrhizobium sp. LHD-71]|uniref:hypothetical protein n=1 Tax=Bradyrhizobium sp. LHD-71 TaxID=3072141 RepID=UPI00280F9C30|nr:hypothetical protein [Bradyrhizobium sp. LHD-71]MDQ8731748.1 hypothetical protein [Bradyrhizobium sp. LHD-71]
MRNHDLTADEARDLRALAGYMIPSSATYGVPGADDDLIFGDICKSLERDIDDVRRALADLRRYSDGSFADLTPERRKDVATDFREKGGTPLASLVRIVLLCYYRDDRVMHALGQEPRAPFPKGHMVEQGDLSLLDPVRARKPLWRRVK